MSARKESNQQLLDDFALTDDDLTKLVLDLRPSFGKALDDLPIRFGGRRRGLDGWGLDGGVHQ
jgi:hypothetical protein